MNRPPEEPLPPEVADTLLREVLPEGVVGLSILGDLHQEFEELRKERGGRPPVLWYWRAALGLTLRYGAQRAKSYLLGTPGRSMGMEMMTTWLADLRYGVRMLVRTPLLSLVAVLTIALGVALTTHTYSSIYGTVLRGVPIPDGDRLTFVGGTRLDLGITEMEFPSHDFEDIRAQQTTFEDLGAFYQSTANVAGDAGPPERFAGAYVSDNALDVAGVQPILGRTFLQGEDDPDAALVVVLGHHVWQNRYGSDPQIVGKTLRLNGETAEIVGVMPEGFRFPFLEDLWAPHRIDVAGLERGRGPDLDVFGKLREGVSLDAARTELTAIVDRLAEAYPESNAGLGVTVSPYVDRFMPPAIQAVLWVMLAAAFGVLLIACANVANLLMARASTRSREVAIRVALGAGRWRVIRQLLTEAVVLALVGGAVGTVLAWAGVVAYQAAIADIYKPYWIQLRMDPAVLLFGLGTTALASIAAGIFPAIRASGVTIGENLKDEGRGSSSLRLGRLTTFLVVSEIAVSCALLVGAGFMIRSVMNVGNIELGFQTEGVMTGRVRLFANDYPDAESRDQFFLTLEERLAEEPGVVSVALGSSLPGLGGEQFYISLAGESYASERDHPVVRSGVVSHDYFETLGIPVVSGRVFDRTETRMGGDDVAIVNESFAATYLPQGDVLGAQVRLGLSESERPWRRIVGVVPDTYVGGNVGGIGDDKERPERLYLPRGALDWSFASIAVRTEGDPVAFAPTLRRIVTEIDPNLPVYDLMPLGAAIDEATWAFALFGTLFTVVGLAALFMAAVGLYGVMAFGVTQRRQEMGVRMALGAESGVIHRMILAKGAWQLGLGMALGLLMGFGMSQGMRFVLFGVETNDPVVYGGVILTLAASGLAACILPARAATRTDPVEAMRGSG